MQWTGEKSLQPNLKEEKKKIYELLSGKPNSD
jgi:hypothetical protein